MRTLPTVHVPDFPTINLPDLSPIISIAKEHEAMLQGIREHEAMLQRFRVEMASRFAEQVSYFQRYQYEVKWIRDFHDEAERFREGMKRHDDAHSLVSSELPKRGWYLSGHEPCTLTLRLATAIRARDWDAVDQELLNNLPEFKIDALAEWLKQEGVLDCCVNRILLFLKDHKEGNYEQATFLGVPLLDEVAKHFYENKDFTTKGGKPRPGIAVKTVNGPDLQQHCESYVRTFGSLQSDCDPRRLADENYWNRHAIVHGHMKRQMGLKDSAKCLMALNFLFSARKDEADSA